MNLNILLNDISNNFLSFLKNWFTAFAVIWTFVEAVTSLLFTGSESIDNLTKRWVFVLGLGGVSLIYAIYNSKRIDKISLNLGGRKTTVNILYGDIFKFDGAIVIPASRFFESEIENYISSKSLQAFTITKLFGGNTYAYRKKLDESLKDKDYTTVHRLYPNEKKFEFGTTSIIEHGSLNLIHVALTETEINQYRTYNNSNISTLVLSLNRMWNDLISYNGIEKISIPLLGSGISGINLNPNRLLELNITVLEEVLYKGNNISEINIVLHRPTHFDKINLSRLI